MPYFFIPSLSNMICLLTLRCFYVIECNKKERDLYLLEQKCYFIFNQPGNWADSARHTSVLDQMGKELKICLLNLSFWFT